MGVQTDEDGIKIPIYSYREIEAGFVKRYDCVSYKLVKVQGCARNLIEYLATVMDSNNVVELNAHRLDVFLKYLKDNCEQEVTYSDIQLRRSIKALKDLGALISISRGVYQVNPELYFKGDSEKRRMDMIKESLEKGIGIN